MAFRWTMSTQLHARIPRGLLEQVRALATRRRTSLSELIRRLLIQELAAARAGSGSAPDESAVREMAILLAAELVLKLQEASIPGGVTLSRRLLEDAARAAIERIELVESRLREDGSR